MKISTLATTLLSFNVSKFVQVDGRSCAPKSLEFSETIGLKVEKVGSVPVINTGAFTYNMAPMDNFDGDSIYFLDQNNGLIYSYSTSTGDTQTLFDMNSSPVPDGLTLDWTYGGASATYRVKSMTQGLSSDEVIVVFASSTLPTGWTEADAKLPPPGAFGQWVCSPESEGGMVWIPDIYRPGILPECFASGAGLPTFVAYDAFYKFKIVDGELVHPEPFFVIESAILPGHLGSGIVTVDDKVLWSSGDCTVFGVDGAYAPQLDHEHCGKILSIDPNSKGVYDIVAKGVRNSQQMRVFTPKPAENFPKSPKSPKSTNKAPKMRSKAGRNSNRALKFGKAPKSRKYVAFMEIGGVTAEEVNAFPIDSIGGPDMPNFGWGRNLDDGKTREGTFYVDMGIGGVLGTQPACAEDAPIGEPGYVQPWIQFGRTATDFFYGICSIAVPTSGTDKLKLLWTEFNTGKILGTEATFVEGAPPAKSYKLRIYGADGMYLENGLNDLVKEELGEVFYYRGDPRLFHFPDGQAGVFIERTGVFYKITEVAI